VTIKTETYVLPSHFLSTLINGDYTGLDASDEQVLDAFLSDGLKRHGRFVAMTDGENQGFMVYHDMQGYGVLACDCVEVIFDVGS
jgi:hypothetical protein